jgi:uncharacterized phage protein (TIGR01671 family)
MREIKFRVWDLTHRKPNMCKVLWFKFYDKKLNYMACEEDSVWLCESDSDGIGIFHSVPISKVILMQSTGVKDDNGKEIYEGDILDFGTWDNDDIAERGVVEYNTMRGAYIITYYSPYGGEGFDLLNNEESPIEVIGNIYENPELLRKE